LCEAVAMLVSQGAGKLRRRHLTVLISTSQFRRNQDNIYSALVSWQLPFPISYALTLSQAATALVERIDEPGFSYYKVKDLLKSSPERRGF
jgi:hypothetical protein